MKISFQIIHNYQKEPLKVIGEALHLTFQDDMYNPKDLRTILDTIEISLNIELQSNEKLCYFEVDIDSNDFLDGYEINFESYKLFIDGFIGRLKNENGFIRLVKFQDEIRHKEYADYYLEISEIEMKVREVFSFIFYYKYSVNEVDNLEEYDVKYPAEKPTTKDFEDRNENPFFYFTFTGYYQFEKTKEIPAKDILPLIQSNELYESLRNYLNLRGILEERHVDFLRKIKEKLDSIEKVRNCIAHNRALSNKVISNYNKSKSDVFRFIRDFWSEEIRIEQELELVRNPINIAERYSFERVNDLLSVTEWNEYNNEVVIHDFWEGMPDFRTSQLEDLKAYLVEISDNTARAHFPPEQEARIAFEQQYDGNRLVEKILSRYKTDLIVLGWI